MEEELRALLQRYQGGESEAAPELISRLSPLVKGLARRYAGTSSEIEDYYQVGMLGLLKAVARFKTEVPVKFTTFALPWIRGEMLCYHRHTASPVKVSRSLWEQARALNLCREQLLQELQREPTLSELSRACGIPVEEISLITESTLPLSALEEETTATREGASQEEQLIDRISLREGIMQLTPMERRIIVLRFFQEQTQAQVGRSLTLSQRQVSRLEKRILGRLRRYLQP
ncbi:MAG TPA: sigma-70 family RNA polymerase sigma factor [Bacillota bacterium]|nr:sigma-70 family RNA polymerase sigma factor [Bacillota bacterium]